MDAPPSLRRLLEKVPATERGTGTWLDRYLDAPLPDHDRAQAAAWTIHVELRTRIATQELPLHSGDDATALASLRDVFALVRGTLEKEGPDAGEVGAVIMTALNRDLRPLTAYWHPRLVDKRLEQADEAGDFRADLRVVQHKMNALADYLGYVALQERYAPHRLVRASLVPARRPPALAATTAVPALDELIALENDSIRARRARLGVAGDRAVGLALSGGGLRSASFGLGVLVALSRAGLYRHFDYLSTVSGGGYTGTLLSTWARSKAAEPDSDATRKALRRGALCDDAIVEHLRDRTRYLIDGGPLRLARAAVPISLGILASLAALVLTTIPTTLLFFGGYEAMNIIADISSTDRAVVPGAAVLLLLVALLVVERVPRWRDRAGAPIASVIVGAVVLALPIVTVYGMRAAMHYLRHGGPIVIAALSIALTAGAHLLRRRAATLRVGRVLLLVSPWLAYGLALTFLVGALDHTGAFVAWGVALGVSTLILFLTDVNEHSPHAYYRDRLAETYCVKVEGGTVAAAPPPRLDELTDLAPVHLVNATANLPATRARNSRGRGAAAFVFSKHGWTYPRVEEGRIQSAFVSSFVRDVDLATAIAISGAAVAPFMGTTTPNGASPWLTLFNIRLSYWLRNPAKGFAGLPSGIYLLRELCGLVDENALRLNLSDGGHFENLAVYELLRRKCRYIVAIDGEEDRELQFGSLMKLILLARIDFGADVRIDVDKLRLDAGRFSRAHFGIGRITYHDQSEGTLLYLKLSITGDEPSHLLSYRRRQPQFPHHSTADQVFDEEQFEAYRALGQHIGERLFRTELVGETIASAAAAHAEAPGEVDGVAVGEWMDAIRGALERVLPAE